MANPRIGEVNIGIRTLLTIPFTFRALVPTPMIVAPSSPPISAWLLELGRPCCQVMRFQLIAPMSDAATIAWVVVWSFDQAAADRRGDGCARERPDEVERRRHEDRPTGRQRSRRDRRGDRVRGVVESIRVVEGHRQQHDEHEHGGHASHR